MRIIFFGTPSFAVPSLRALIERGDEICLVVTSPDKPRRRQSDPPEPTAVKVAALAAGLPLFETEDVKSEEFLNRIALLQPDLVVVVAFKILPPALFSIPKMGIFNLHASLLPKYRGAAPIQWALINGEKITGVTTFFLEEKVDTGKILIQKSLAIHPDETYSELSERLSFVGAEAVSETVNGIAARTLIAHLQDNHAATRAPKLFRENTRIDWNKRREDIHNMIRGLSKPPGAWTMLEGKTVWIYRSRLSANPTSDMPEQLPAGRVFVFKDRLFVSTGNGWIEILQMQLEGKRELPVSEFLRGYRKKEGDCFV